MSSEFKREKNWKHLYLRSAKLARAKQLGVSEAEAEADFAKQFPIGRIVEPSDIAPMITFLASRHASAITGQSIAIDGGSTPGTYY
jgi:NAD(P)-dependent dehydrogenase (short-subunit alcohol dehydrogenase family)